jgi:hypothetical protein
LFHRLVDGFLNILPACDVTLHGESINAKVTFYFICHSTAPLEVHIGDDDLCAFPGKHAGSSLPYTGTGCCGTKSYLVFQFHGITSRGILLESDEEKQEEKKIGDGLKIEGR